MPGSKIADCVQNISLSLIVYLSVWIIYPKTKLFYQLVSSFALGDLLKFYWPVKATWRGKPRLFHLWYNMICLACLCCWFDFRFEGVELRIWTITTTTRMRYTYHLCCAFIEDEQTLNYVKGKIKYYVIVTVL